MQTHQRDEDLSPSVCRREKVRTQMRSSRDAVRAHASAPYTASRCVIPVVQYPGRTP